VKWALPARTRKVVAGNRVPRLSLAGCIVTTACLCTLRCYGSTLAVSEQIAGEAQEKQQLTKTQSITVARQEEGPRQVQNAAVMNERAPLPWRRRWLIFPRCASRSRSRDRRSSRGSREDPAAAEVRSFL